MYCKLRRGYSCPYILEIGDGCFNISNENNLYMHTYVKMSKKNIDFSILLDEYFNVKNDSL